MHIVPITVAMRNRTVDDLTMPPLKKNGPSRVALPFLHAVPQWLARAQASLSLSLLPDTTHALITLGVSRCEIARLVVAVQLFAQNFFPTQTAGAG